MSRFDPTFTVNTIRLIEDIWATFRNKNISSFREKLSVIELHCSENPSGVIGVSLISILVFVLVLIAD